MVQIGAFDHRNQTFWEVVDARMPILRNSAFQAIVGVGPPETPAADAWAEVQVDIGLGFVSVSHLVDIGLICANVSLRLC